MKRTIFLIIIICVILYFQHPHINEINNTYEILQYNNPNKSYFENMLSEKKISIFTNIPNEFYFKDIKPEFFTKDFVLSLNKNKKYFKIIKKNMVFYQIPLCIKVKHNLIYLDKPTNILYQNNYRFLLLNLKNTIKITLFYPSQYENLYFNKKKVSTIDFYNADYDKYTKLNNVKYIEILLHKNQMISIPYKWMYILNIDNEETLIEDKNSILISYANESIFSKLLKKK